MAMNQDCGLTIISRMEQQAIALVTVAMRVDRAIQNTDLSSSYELIKLIEPFVRNATANAGEFDAAVRNAIRVYLPELSEGLTQEVVLALAN